ncbi:uncharacterized protein [Parasteatoda tepidariorum]
MDFKILATFLIFLTLTASQKASHKSYDWRSSSGSLEDWPKISSLIPYSGGHATESYPNMDDSESMQFDSRYNQYDMKPYMDSFFHSEEQNSPYKYLSDPLDSSYSVHHDDSPMNITKARIGGFAGSGDTLGFGAYEHPVKSRKEEEFFPEMPKLDAEFFPEMFKFSRRKHRMPSHHAHDPMLIHPIPPPL